jgi:uncharacterized repeat protein (TIGR02543 family)
VDLFAKWTDGSVTLPTPTKTGYTFGGWYADSGLNNSVGAAGATYTPSTNITLYAKWAIITYNITYELNGGSVSTANPTSYNIEPPTFTLNNPSKENYHFVGWTKGNNNTLLPTVTIEQGSTGNLDYTAHYKTNNFTVGEFSYQWTSGTEVKVTACNSDATLITIPATVTNEDVIYSVTAIDASAFSGCTNLLAVILYTETPPTLGSSAFKDCTALDAIYVPAGTAETYQAADGWKDYAGKIRAIDGSYGDNVYYAYNSTTKTLYIFGTGYMTEYFGELIIPWYNYRTDITTVIIGHGVTSIGSMAFNGCTGLTSIEIPASVMTIVQWAFDDCNSLLSVTIYAPELSEYGYGYGAFYNNADGRKIYVFKNCVKTYKEQAWKTDDDRGMGFYEDDILPIESINLKDNDDNSSLIAAAISYTGPAATRPSTPSVDTSMSTLRYKPAPSC